MCSDVTTGGTGRSQNKQRVSFHGRIRRTWWRESTCHVFALRRRRQQQQQRRQLLQQRLLLLLLLLLQRPELRRRRRRRTADVVDNLHVRYQRWRTVRLWHLISQCEFQSVRPCSNQPTITHQTSVFAQPALPLAASSRHCVISTCPLASVRDTFYTSHGIDRQTDS